MRAIGDICNLYEPDECSNYLKATRYASNQTLYALGVAPDVRRLNELPKSDCIALHASLACADRLDAGVASQKVGLEGDLVDPADDLAERTCETSAQRQHSAGLCRRRIVAEKPNGANRDTARDEEPLSSHDQRWGQKGYSNQRGADEHLDEGV